MPHEAYYVFLIMYVINIIYILKEDLETKYIPLLWFYPFVILSGIYYYSEFGYISWLLFIVLYFLCILTLDLIEHFKWPIASIWEKWKFLDTGVYDYFLYIFIWDLVISNIVQNFWTLHFVFDFGIIFITTVIAGVFFLIIHQKKVKMLVFKNNIQTYEDLDTALYERKLKAIQTKEIFQSNNLYFNDKQKELLSYYKNRVPLFLFWNIFILSFVITKL